MDYEADFLSTVRDIAAQCLARGKQAREWSDRQGTSVKGWSIETQDRPITTRGNPGARGGWFEESWGDSATILATDGTLWSYVFEGYEGSDYPNGAQLSTSVAPIGTRQFVGRAGKPFAEWKAKIERLPYT